MGHGEDESSEKYWFTKDKIDKINSVHNYLDSLAFVESAIFNLNFRCSNSIK